MSTSLVVEFCGLPGSGKTTTAEHAARAVLARGTDCLIADREVSAAASRRARVARRTAASVRESARRPLYTLETAWRISTVGQAERRDSAAVLAQWLATGDLVARAHRRPGVHLVEEGWLQTLWTLLLRADSPPSAQLLTRQPAANRSDLVILLDVPVDLADARLEARASRHSRTQRLPREQRRAELERGARLLEQLAVASPVPVWRVRVDAGTTAEQLGERVASVIAYNLRSVGA